MKFPNYLKNVFAGLGVLSLIFYTCSAESSSDDSSSNLPQITGGTYQVENVATGQNVATGTANPPNIITVLNTESGVMKTYYRSSSFTSNLWQEIEDTTITFTH